MPIPPDFSLKSYDFPLPERLIAQEPPAVRGTSRLLALDRASGATHEGAFADILRYLPDNCLLVVNNSRVVPARVQARRPGGGNLEMLLLTPLPLLEPRPLEEPSALAAPGTFLEKASAFSPPLFTAPAEALLRPAKKIRLGEEAVLAADLAFVPLERGEFGRFSGLLRWRGDVREVFERCGVLPLPPYIRRPAGEEDAARYQTAHAREDKAGSVAAPTAGLHFTPELRRALEDSGREWAEVTLYVGYGTFSPVRCEDIREHPMHAEYVELPGETARLVNKARAEGRAVVAVGTTAARTLEGVWATCGEARPFQGWINIFLYPGRPFHVLDGLVTNFHLPESSLLMLVSALAGRERVLAAYAEAVRREFRFFSYGDAMLIV